MNYYLIIILSIFIIIFNSAQPRSIIEGYESYENCVRQGYPNDFCMQTPIKSKLGESYCKCANGEYGSFHMGDGKCYCYLYGPRDPYYTQHVFHDYL